MHLLNAFMFDYVFYVFIYLCIHLFIIFLMHLYI